MTDRLAGKRATVLTITLAIGAAATTVASASEVRPPSTGATGPAAKILHFPQDQSVGVVYTQDENLVIPETVYGFHSGYTYAERENFCPARGEVRIPPGQRVILMIRGVGATLARCRTALESLEPNDLYGLVFFSLQPVELSPELVPLIARLTGLKSLALGEVRVSPKDLARIASLPALEVINPSLGLSDAGMAEIAKMRTLKRLNLGPDRMTDKGLASLGQLKSLEELNLYGNPALTDDGLKALANLPVLRYLRLGKEGLFTDRGMEYVAAMPSLRVLWLDTHNVTDEGLRQLSKSRSLERLCVYWLEKITDRGVAYLRDMPQLKGFSAGQARLTDASLAYVGAMPNIDYLQLPIGFTDGGIRSLTRLSRLEVLRINTADNSPLTDETLRAVCQIRSLKELSIAGKGFTDSGIEMLAGLANLETLNIMQPGADNETLKRLAGLPKLRELSWGLWSNVTMSGLNALNQLGGLENLRADWVHQDGKGLDLSGLRDLKTVRIDMWSQSTRIGSEIVSTSDAFRDSDLACLSGLTKLEDLSLTGPGIGDAGIQHLATVTRLKYLQLGGSPDLTDTGLRHLISMHRLDSLRILNSRITNRGLEHLYPLKTLNILQITTTVPISGQAILRLRTELPHLQTLDLSQPQPARRPAPAKPRIRPQAK